MIIGSTVFSSMLLIRIFQEEELKGEIAKKDSEIEDLRTHLETLLDEEEREKRLSACSDCKI